MIKDRPMMNETDKGRKVTADYRAEKLRSNDTAREIHNRKRRIRIHKAKHGDNSERESELQAMFLMNNQPNKFEQEL